MDLYDRSGEACQRLTAAQLVQVLRAVRCGALRRVYLGRGELGLLELTSEAGLLMVSLRRDAQAS